jgi:ribonuclease P/MRP protein subunit RPP40
VRYYYASFPGPYLILLYSSSLKTTNTSFVSVTCHALPTSPVSYIPYTMTEHGSLSVSGDVPARFPRADSEDTWSLILENGAREEGIQWVIVESLGQWDARW